MSQVIVVTSGKGGVGKTTTTANIGTSLAMLGHKVALLDADIGLRNLDVVMGLENRIVFDIVDVIEGKCTPAKALIRDKRTNSKLYLLPAAQTKDKDAISPEQMIKLCETLKEDFDYIIVDCPAGIEGGFKNAIAAANRAIVVTTPEVSAVRDADRIIGLLEANGIKNPMLVLNRIRVDMVASGGMMSLDDVVEILAIEVLGVVPDDESIIVSTNLGEPAVLDSKSVAGNAFNHIARRITGEEVPFMDLSVKGGFISKIKNMFKG